MSTTALNPKFKSFVDHIAYFQNKNRLFPKLILAFWGWVGYELIRWITSVPDLSQIGMGAGSVVTGVFMSIAAYGKFYVETGPNGKFGKDKSEDQGG
ncbi:hypothetical protein GR11A_00134 [Vibrio phage vB_VcorM_GR11A]|nr:hypothetical protein GR11A_00134 [Vibrio phage vB_VcorM_GR11A]